MSFFATLGRWLSPLLCLYISHSSLGSNPTDRNVSIKLITELPVSEMHESHLFHSGLLWVGRAPDKMHYSIEIYHPDGRRSFNVRLNHAPERIYPIGPHKALVMGSTIDRFWKSHYTIISIESPDRISLSLYTFARYFMVDEFIGNEDDFFFSVVREGYLAKMRYFDEKNPLPPEPSEANLKPSDPDYEPELLVPLVGFHPDQWSSKVSGPGKMALAEDALFVIERNDLRNPMDDNLVKFDLGTKTPSRTFGNFYRQWLTNLLYLPKHRKVAITETYANQVLLIDTQTNRLESVIPIPDGLPYALAQLGHCLIVSSATARVLNFFDLNSANRQHIARWDLSGSFLGNSRAIAVDPKSGRLFIRSTFNSNEGPGTMNSVVSVEDLSGATFKQCQDSH